MIPKKMRLRNFLSYKECTVDFTGVQLAVLCGRNGDGKSALMDGITWALWGKCRGAREDERIHLQEQEMLVDLEFEVAGDIFKVVRKRTRGRASGALEFFQRADDGSRIPLTGGTIAETEREIVRRVRLDYDTFVNSAFIAQGRSNEFTNKTPAERKVVFGKVLGLERYEQLAGAANDRKKDRTLQAAARERETEEARKELDQLPGVEQELARVTEEGAVMAPRVDELDKAVAELRQAAAAYRALEVRLGEAEKRSQTAIRAHTEAEGRRASLKQRLTELDQLLAGAEAITTRWKELEVARVAEQAMTRQQEAAQRHEMAFQKAGERIAVELARLEAALSTAQGLLAEAESAITRLPGLRAECKRLAKEREALGELDREKEDLRGRESALRQAAATAVVQAEHAKLVNVDVKAKEAQLTGASTCPVCQGPLTAAEVARLLGEYQAQRDGLRETHEHAKAEAAAGLKEAHALAARLRLIETDWKRREGALRAAEGEAEARLQRAEEVEQKLPALRREVAAGADVITREAFGEAERAKQTAAREALKACGYDASGHTTLRERIGVLAGADEEYRSLAQAQTAATGILDQLTELEGAIDALRTAGAESAREESEAREALESATDAGPRLHQAEEELSGFRNLQGELLRKQGKLEQRREHLVAQEARLERTRDELKALREEEHTYGDLAAAFGKNGVQAMLIERSLPRVQQMVNETLDRMTGGRIHVGLSTQRFSASGKVTETLDIRISDDVGTRDYAMYSGGEAFRVDFALRIALARLLAERSGASLPTLIIDEGFGTQDAEGLDRLVEAITAIQEDFRLILVVTHIEELRERFGRRIEVTKDAQRGSFARVV